MPLRNDKTDGKRGSGLGNLTPEQRAAMSAAASATRRAKTEARLRAGVPTLREAASAFCASCLYDPLAGGNWREQVKACTSRNCPLWPHRPGADAEMPEGFVPQSLQGVLAAIRGSASGGRAGIRPDDGSDAVVGVDEAADVTDADVAEASS